MLTKWTRAVNNMVLANSKPSLVLSLGIGGEVDDDSQPEEGEEGEEQAVQETDSVTIEVPDYHGSPPQPAENDTTSSQGSRPSTAEEQRQQEPSPTNQLAVPWGQSGLMGIGIDEVGMNGMKLIKFKYLILISIICDVFHRFLLAQWFIWGLISNTNEFA